MVALTPLSSKCQSSSSPSAVWSWCQLSARPSDSSAHAETAFPPISTHMRTQCHLLIVKAEATDHSL